MMTKSRLAGRVLSGLSLLAVALGEPRLARAQQSVCTAVQIQLGQQAALEREAFTAQLNLTDNSGTQGLTNVQVNVTMTDPNGNPSTSLFFSNVTSLNNVSAVDGTGVIQPGTTASITWLIVPTAGAGGALPAGIKYNVSAQISYAAGGSSSTITTVPAVITVYPQPLINLEYVLPFEVFGVDPFTLTGSTVPFPLGLRVSNVGYGPANNFQVTGAQPQITDDKQGLPVSYQIIGTYLGSTQQPSNTLTIPYGNIASSGTELGSWMMTASYSGRFDNFVATFTHSAALGGAMTSLIQNVTTYTLIKDVLDDTPGHDQQFDLLVNTSTPRAQMETLFLQGLPPQPDAIMESDRPGFTPVQNVTASTTGVLSGFNGAISWAFDSTQLPNYWVHAQIPFPQGSSVTVVSAIRSDGKVLNPRNFWITPHIDNLTDLRTYYLHVLDYTAAQPLTYTLTFNVNGLLSPPNPISNLAISTVTPGGVGLSWNATGASGSSGTIIGGQYAIFASTNLALTPSPLGAYVAFSTATPAAAAQNYLLSGLLGNATYQFSVFLANSAGQFSPDSNVLQLLTLADPPASVRVATETATSFTLAWSTSVNAPGTSYRLQLSTTPGSIVADTGYATDISSAAFGGLAVNQAYSVTALELNSAQAPTPAVVVSSATTLAVAPSTATPTFLGVFGSSFTVQWQYGADPPSTSFQVQLSTVPGRWPLYVASPWVQASSYTFTNLHADATYYARVQARNSAQVPTAYTNLGGVYTAAIDLLPPRTSLNVGAPSFSTGTLYTTAATTFSLSAADDLYIVGDGDGIGVAQTFIAVDTTSFSGYAGAFSLVSEGTHTVSYFSVDRASNTEISHNAPVAVDLTPPITSLQVLGSSVTLPQGGLAFSSSTLVNLAAVDPVSNGVAAGVASTYYVIDQNPFAPACESIPLDPTQPNGTCANEAYDGPFTLAPGTHVVYYFSEDNVGNQELVDVATVTVYAADVLPPRTSLAIGAPSVSSGTTTYATDVTTFSLTAVDDLLTVGDGLGFGVAQTFFSIDAAPFSVYAGSFSLTAEGSHALAYYSIDVSGNVEASRTANVDVDLTPPMTTLLVAGSSVPESAGGFVASSMTPVSLSAIDPVSNGVASGVAATYYVVDQYPFSPSCASTPLDPTQPNGTCANEAYAGPFTLSIGTHTVYYFSEDAVGNQELVDVSTVAVYADVQPPRSTLLVGAPSFSSSTLYVADATTFSVTAVDDLVTVGDGLGLGVAATYVSIDSAAFAVYAGSFTLDAAGEGAHTLSYYSVDDVGNAEVVRSTAAVLDQTPPVTTLLVQGSSITTPIGVQYSTSTLLTLSALDPISHGAASGVAATYYVVDQNPFSPACENTPLDPTQPNGTCANEAYDGSFSLSTGTHSIYYFSEDAVGNQELVNVSSVTIYEDVLPPRTYMTANGVFYSSGTLTYGTASTAFAFTAYSDALVVGDDAGVGVAQTYVAVDTVAYSSSPGVLYLNQEGSHAISFYSVDYAGNTEVARSSSVAIDLTPPITTLLVAGSTVNASAPISVGTGTALSFSAVDPSSNGVASGVADTFYVVDQYPFSPACESVPLDPTQPNGTCANEAYDGPFTLSGGTHTIYYFSEDNVGNQELVDVATVTVNVVDVLPPRTTLVIGAPSYSSGTLTYATSATTFSLTAVDDALTVGDGAGVGVAATYVAIDSAPFSVYSGSFSIAAEGLHAISYYSVDLVGNVESTHTATVAIDDTPPITTLTVQGSSATDVSGDIDISAATPISLSAVDPVSNGVASGVAATYYVIDANPFSPTCENTPLDPTQPNGTCANEAYDGAFTLSAGTHTVYYFSEDNVGNQELVDVSSFNVSAASSSLYTLNPSTGPIGIPFTIAGPGGFGAYAGGNTQVFVGTVSAPLSLWNDATIQGTIPGLSTGAYAVTISTPGSGGARFVADFTLTALSSATLAVSSGPIGTPFTFTGTGFGPYAGALTNVVVAGSTAPLSVWNDSQISGNIPFVSSGSVPVVIERLASGGGLETSATFFFQVSVPTITAVVPSSGPIGISYTLSGQSFGAYEGALTQVLIGGATTPLSLWNNTTITGTVPGGLAPGNYPVQVEIMASGGGLVMSNTAYFQIAGMTLAAVTPSSGPIGATYSLSGSGFGAYAGANTQVLIGGATTQLSVWNDTSIQGTIPTLATGTYSVVVERVQGSTASYSAASSFTVVYPAISTVTPAAGPLGAAFTVSGSGFGPYAGSLTQLLLGGTTCTLSLWNDQTISATVPAGVSTGTQTVVVERVASDGGVVKSTAAVFYVSAPTANGVSPSTGPVGVPFTITGSGFGNYGGSADQIRFGVGGSTAPLSVWNDATISGNVPALSTGAYTVFVERASGGVTNDTAVGTFTVTTPQLASVVPSSGPIGAPFTVSGSGFGPYTGGGTQVLMGGVAAPLSVWNDSTISGSVPGSLSSGTYSLALVFTASGGAQSVSAGTFTVVIPVISSITPTSGQAGDGVMLTGTGFGPYQGSASNVLVAGSTVALSVWNDQEIVWTVPSTLGNGTDPVVVSLTPAGGSVQSSSVAFTVTGGSGGGGGGEGFMAARPAFTIVSKPATPLAAEPDYYFQGDLVFSTNVVASIVTPSGAAVQAPAGAMAKKSALTLQRMPAASLSAANAALAKQGFSPVGQPIEFGPSGLTFSQPVTITLPYDPSLVASGELGTVAIYYFDPVADEWSALQTQLVSGHFAVAAQTSHFSLYQPLRLSPLSAGGGAFDTFGLRAHYAFPNPSNHGAAVDFRLQPGLADSVDLHIYNVAGRRVLSTSISNVNFIDDHNGLGSQDTYDYIWDVSGVGSGVYTYVFIAHKSGEHDIVATGKVGVIK